jgi:pimeloyl-ACP methyl ester carboxylesterase
MTNGLNYELGGRGPVVVLLHPVGLDLTFLAPVAENLRNEFTVLTVDQRGPGAGAFAGRLCRRPAYPADNACAHAGGGRRLLLWRHGGAGAHAEVSAGRQRTGGSSSNNRTARVVGDFLSDALKRH